MNMLIEAESSNLKKYNEELCGDKVEIIRNNQSTTVVLADGLGSGVKANILSTLTSKIIATMISNGATIEESVETIASTLPQCNVRGIAYSTFSILQIFNNGECYLVEFDNPAMFFLRGGKLLNIEKNTININNKTIKESRFSIKVGDVFILISDGVIHAGIGQTLNLGWQWEHVKDYLYKIYKKNITAKNLCKLLISVCDNLYAQKPGDDTTVAVIKVYAPSTVTVMVGPPIDKNMDATVVKKLMNSNGKKVVCGGTTSQIASRVLGNEIKTSFEYFNSTVPPTAEIKGIDLTTEGVLTLGKALEKIKKYNSFDITLEEINRLNSKDGASKLAKLLIEEGTNIRFLIGRAINPAHQNPELPLSLGIKLNIVEEITKLLRNMGKEVEVEYY